MTLAVAAAFEAAFQRKPTPDEVDRLNRVMNVLDVRENDAIMVVESRAKLSQASRPKLSH
ncbi:MAG TPA: hypothetical protein PKH69_09735 [Thiobacillaceae bacterium]|nr:hypothetical protein [Thiobacillaceae bacterium]HNU64756.1 hypothetical protein [Thiobacillaceae bacterium]